MKRVRTETDCIDDFVSIVCFLEKHEQGSVPFMGLMAVLGNRKTPSMAEYLGMVEGGEADDILQYIRRYNTKIEPPKELFNGSASPSY